MEKRSSLKVKDKKRQAEFGESARARAKKAHTGLDQKKTWKNMKNHVPGAPHNARDGFWRRTKKQL